MRGRQANWLCCVGLIAASTACARDFEVRLLKGDLRSGCWGTSEFQCWVNSLGAVRNVSVRGTQIARQAAALYVRPCPPDTEQGVRAVQGERIGLKGLTLQVPEMQTHDERGTRVFEFRHRIANRAVLSGRPLCDARQKVVITPAGEIHIDYDFEWLVTLRWQMFEQQILYENSAVAGRQYLGLTSGRVYAGTLDPGPAAQQRIRNALFERLTVRPAVGPVHLVWRAKARANLYWSSQVRLTFRPGVVGRNGYIYRGLRDRIAYSILLPVSQQ